MPCTTILVGKNATYDGSTMIARNDDAGGNDHFTPKKMIVVQPKEQPRVYKAVLSSVEIPLPENPLRYTAMPNAVEGKGIWGACGVNEARTGMTATETITSNPRVLGADPLVKYQPAEDGKEEVAALGMTCHIEISLYSQSHLPQIKLRHSLSRYRHGEGHIIVLLPSKDSLISPAEQHHRQSILWENREGQELCLGNSVEHLT